MNATEFDDVVKRVKALWAGRVFHAKWNEDNQRIAFKKLSVFRQDEVLEAFEHHRYDNPDAREPKFAEVVSRLWAVKKTVASAKGEVDSSYIPSLPALKAWVDSKSDADLAHLWSIAESRWATTFDTQRPDRSGKVSKVAPWSWVRAFREDRRRGPTDALFCYAAERTIDLTFRQSSAEHDIIMSEYDAIARLAEIRRLRADKRWLLDEWSGIVKERTA